MARYNEILVGRFARSVQKLFGIKGEVPVGSLAGEISVTAEIENLPVELRFIAGWRLWGFAVGINASAGNLGALRLRNPSSSGVLAVVEKATFSTTAVTEGFQLNTLFTGVDLTTPGIAIPRDTRGGPPAQSASVCVPSFGNPAATAGGLLELGNILANTTIDLILFEHEEIVLPPGSSVTLYDITVNTGVNLTFWWRERPIEETESL